MQNSKRYKKLLVPGIVILLLFVILPLAFKTYIRDNNLYFTTVSGEVKQFGKVYIDGILGAVLISIIFTCQHKDRKKKETSNVLEEDDVHIGIKKYLFRVNGEVLYIRFFIENPMPFEIYNIKIGKTDLKSQNYEEKVVTSVLAVEETKEIKVSVNLKQEQYKIRMSNKAGNIYEQKLFVVYDSHEGEMGESIKLFMTMAKKLE